MLETSPTPLEKPKKLVENIRENLDTDPFILEGSFISDDSNEQKRINNIHEHETERTMLLSNSIENKLNSFLHEQGNDRIINLRNTLSESPILERSDVNEGSNNNVEQALLESKENKSKAKKTDREDY